MVCSPGDNSLNPPNLGPPPNIGFGPIFSPAQTPFVDIKLPIGIPEDILQLLSDIFAKIPGGTLSPNADDAFRTVFSAVGSLLNQLGPYLALYNFFQALLEMIMCIIDVLCALLNPFATISAVIRLFKRCIPNFLSIFPQLALIAMILSFILLLIALIEFLINYLISLINDIIENINALSEAFQVGNDEGILAITQKIASLLCLIEQAFALLISFQALFVIIKALAAIGGGAPCRAGKDDCCSDEFCPPFILDSGGEITGTFGRLIYHRQVEQDVVSAGLPSNVKLPSLRTERWQFVNDGASDFDFKSIITPINGNIYWPEPFVFDKGSNIKIAVPYTIDLSLELDPSLYNNNIANSTVRNFKINDVIITTKPYIGVETHDNQIDYGTEAPSSLNGTSFGNYDGTLKLIGGTVYEENGITPVLDIFGNVLSLDTLINSEDLTSTVLPFSEDGYQIQNIDYILKINHAVLLKYQLITAGCQPDIIAEATIIDATTDMTPTITKIGDMPDLDATLECLNSAINTFRDDVSIESAAIFQATIVGCLNDLKSDAENVFQKAFTAGGSIFTSEMSLDPEIQFVSEPIKVTVNIKDQGGVELGTNIPQNVSDELASLLRGYVTFGDISDFTYDGYQYFIADITSNEVGTGELTVSFNNNLFSDILNRDNNDLPTEIQIRKLPYRFVGGIIGGNNDGAIRRDETDTAHS